MESAKEVNPSKYKNSNRLTDGQEHKNIYASNAIKQHESGLNRRSSKPSCNQSADGNWDQWQVNSKVTEITLQQSAGGNLEGSQSQALVVVYAETFSHFIHTNTSFTTIQDQHVSHWHTIWQESDGGVILKIRCFYMLTRMCRTSSRQHYSGEDRERLVTNRSL